jgi:hypothetical protein
MGVMSVGGISLAVLVAFVAVAGTPGCGRRRRYRTA